MKDPNLRMVEAIEQNSLSMVQNALFHGADIKNCVKGDNPAMNLAILNNNSDLFEHLLNAYISGRTSKDLISDQYIKDALLLAARTNSTGALDILIKKSPTLDTKDHSGCTALHFAAEWGEAESIRKLIEQGADIHIENDHGSTAAHFAAEQGQHQALKVFLEAGFPVDRKRANDMTIALISAYNSDNQCLSLSVKHGADLTLPSLDGSNIFHAIAASSKPKLLIDSGDELRKHKSIINSQNMRNERPIDIAAKNSIEAFDAITDCGADIFSPGPDGSSIFNNAIFNEEDLINYIMASEVAKPWMLASIPTGFPEEVITHLIESNDFDITVELLSILKDDSLRLSLISQLKITEQDSEDKTPIQNIKKAIILNMKKEAIIGLSKLSESVLKELASDKDYSGFILANWQDISAFLPTKEVEYKSISL